MRETGPAAKKLEGDGAEHYIGPARVLLGQLKSDMALGGLEQGARTLQLPNGVVLKAESRFGQDTVHVIEPPPPPPEVPAPAPPPPEWREQRTSNRVKTEVTTPLSTPYATAGYCEDGDGHRHLTYWPSPGTPVEIVLPQGTTQAFVNAISDDGLVVVGYANFPGSPSNRPFYWTRRDGHTVLTAPTAPAQATGVDLHGSRICGNSQGGPWVWDRDGGLTLLPLEGATSGSAQCISQDGKYVAGSTTDGSSVSSVTVWHDDGSGWKLVAMAPQPGTSSEYPPSGVQNPGDPIPTRADSNGAVDVRKDGLVTMVDDHQTVTPYYVQDSGGVTSFGVYYQVTAPGVEAVRTFDAVSGAVTECTTGAARAHSDGRFTIVGNFSHGVPGSIEYYIPNIDTTHREWGQYYSFIPEGWYWRARSGRQSLGMATFVSDISEDARMLVGSIRPAGADFPAYWLADQGMQRFALLPETVSGQAQWVSTSGSETTTSTIEAEWDGPTQVLPILTDQVKFDV